MQLKRPRLFEFSSGSNESERSIFADKFRGLLPGMEFEEPTELLEARTAVAEALISKGQGSDIIQSVWIEYAKICEQIVDDMAETSPQYRAQLQIATLVHKALIFREAKDMWRYSEALNDAREYAYNMYLDGIVDAIDAELDNLTS